MQHTASELGLRPEQCVFVDDLYKNCRGAEAVGMASVQLKLGDSTTALRRLGRMLGLPDLALDQ